MIDAITFFVPGRPFSKKRPRFGKGRAYSDPESVAAEAAVRHYAKRAFGLRSPVAALLPVSLECRFVFERAKTSKAAPGAWHTIKPDADNLLKLVSDALNPLPKGAKPDGWGSAWHDDSQVAMLVGIKTWATATDPEGTTVTVTELPD